MRKEPIYDHIYWEHQELDWEYKSRTDPPLRQDVHLLEQPLTQDDLLIIRSQKHYYVQHMLVYNPLVRVVLSLNECK